MKLRPSDKLCIAFTSTYLLAAAGFAVFTGNTEFIFYIAIMLVLIALFAVVHIMIEVSRPLVWGLSIWGALHMAGGLVPVPNSWPIDGNVRVLYSLWLIPTWLKYDQVVHAYGFAMTTWLCWEGLRRMLAEARGSTRADIKPALGALVLSGAAGMGFGALNEVVEFAATLLLPSTNVGGYNNTGWDLVSNLVGCILAAVAIRLTYRDTRPPR